MSSSTEIANILRVSQIVTLGFIGSVFIFIAAGYAIAADPGAAHESFAVILGIVGVIELTIGEILPGIIVRMNRPNDLKGWLSRKFLKQLLGNVFRESAAIIGLVIYILNPADYMISATLWGLSLLLLVVKFPTKHRFTDGIPPELLRESE